MNKHASGSHTSSSGAGHHALANHAMQTTNEDIIDPGGMGLFRLTMMVITSTICAGIFSLMGDLAAGGAHTAAVIIGWSICFVGVFCLMKAFQGLSQLRPDLTGGIYAYAAAGFGDYVGFNSAYGYWISGCLSNVSFAIMFFGALGYFFPVFGNGNNLLSVICASVVIWVLAYVVTRGVKEAAGINIVVTIAKVVPLALFVVSILMLNKFNPNIFFTNFMGEPGGANLTDQIISTTISLVWIFTGIETAVVISGHAKFVKDVGRATSLGFISVFVLYFLISLLSMGIVPREEMAHLATPSMAGVLEIAIGPIGAAIVNLGVCLSLAGALLGYVIICAETPFEAAKRQTFPKCFARTNKNNAPVVTILVSAAVMQLFLLIAFLSEGTYQFFYACAVSTILIPYVCSAAFYMMVSWKKEGFNKKHAPRLSIARFFGTASFIYTLFLVWTCGWKGIMITTVLFAPGILLYLMGAHQYHKRAFCGLKDAIIVLAVIVLAIASLYLHFSGISPIV